MTKNKRKFKDYIIGSGVKTKGCPPLEGWEEKEWELWFDASDMPWATSVYRVFVSHPDGWEGYYYDTEPDTVIILKGPEDKKPTLAQAIVAIEKALNKGGT